MFYTFSLLFLAIIATKLILIYQNYLQIKKNFEAFCLKWDIKISSKLKVFHPEIPEIQGENWKLIWKKQGKGRSFHHIMKIYFDFPNSIHDFQLAHKNLLSKIKNSENWQLVEKNLYSNSLEIKKQEKFLKEVLRLQSEYGWGILEVKNQKGFYTLIAEPSEPQAWKHLYEVIQLTKLII